MGLAPDIIVGQPTTLLRDGMPDKLLPCYIYGETVSTNLISALVSNGM